VAHFCLLVVTAEPEGVRDALHPFHDDDRDEGPAQPHFIFVEDPHAEPDCEGRRGYWKNPTGKWDGWTIGGRWSGLLGGADSVRIGALSSPTLAAAAMDAAYATVIDGVWREARETPAAQWRAHLAGLASLPPERWLTVVDCHC
jgi:hypothetical protein